MLALALASSAVWGTADFLGGLFSRRFAALRVVAVSQLGALVCITVLFAVLCAINGVPGGSWWAYGIAAGVCNMIALSGFYAALAAGTMGVVSPIAAMGAVIPVILGLLSGDRLALLVLSGLLLALVGVVLASGPELTGVGTRRPMLLAALAGCGFGFTMFFVDHGARSDVAGTIWVMRLTSVALLFGLWWLRRPLMGTARIEGRALPGVWLTGLLDMGANGFFALAASRGALSMAGVLGSLYPVVTVILGRVVLAERLRRIQLLGVAMTLIGVALASTG